ncbi:MAG: tRNA (N(6)-L-threonylcarbamoyladenosine(37)-C(2))-methylthiotransferase MtaB [Candidatus Symbiothrix sp.]|jgi:threonylcarbamoyladenosine tRNA methylthiotransferase MtaB|nr:tRNA (N(6)-L-threonylcarbamoyladenosine(37)-C(2))-methylthiotransferase MtaB [Candidatus Symbiothrix sp.]
MIDNQIFKDKTAAYFTLGCKLNFAETSAIGKHLSGQGIRTVLPGEKADICVVNTCSVTGLADKKCRQAIRRIKNRHPGAFLVVTGCYAQLKPEEVSQIDGVDLVLGAGEKMDILESIGKKIVVSPVREVRKFIPSCSGDDRTRHFLKVQDGCDYYCSYCTIPLARGRSRNGSIAELVRMADAAGREGGKEIVLTGVNIGDFGKTTGETFFGLIKALDKVESIARFRISSIEPNLLTDEILEFIVRSERFTPHFHIPLQSGSDAVLKLMHRKYDTAFFASKLDKIKQLMPDAFIGVDVIAGMRGETDACFRETLHFLQGLPFSRLHVFTYSERPGTVALKIEPSVPPAEKQERSRQLQELSEEKNEAFYRSQTGTVHPVLFEEAKKGAKMYGFTENYIKVETDYHSGWINKLVDVTLSEFNKDKTALEIYEL